MNPILRWWCPRSRRPWTKGLCCLLCGWVVLLVASADGRAALIATFGDSNTAGGSDAYPGLLVMELNQRFGAGQFQVVNHGINGLTTAGLTSQLTANNWLDEDPDIALLMIGGNDLSPILTSPSVTTFLSVVQQATANVQQAVDLIRTHDYPDGRPPVIIVSGYIPNRLPNVSVAGFSINPNIAVQALNESLASQLLGVDMFLLSNYEDVMDPATGKARANLMRDNLHLNQAGRQVVAENFADAIAILVPEPTGAELVLAGMTLMLIRRYRGRRSRFRD